MLVVLALVVVVGAGSVWAVGAIGHAIPSRAGRVADEAARMGADQGREAAWLVAVGRGGSLADYKVEGLDVVVTVDVGGVRSVARARQRPTVSSKSFVGREGLDRRILAALARADAILGQSVPLTSGRRSTQKQAALYASRASNPYPVAVPGFSKHESGLAVDVPVSVASRLAAVSGQTGLCQPFPGVDPVHFELC